MGLTSIIKFPKKVKTESLLNSIKNPTIIMLFNVHKLFFGPKKPSQVWVFVLTAIFVLASSSSYSANNDIKLASGSSAATSKGGKELDEKPKFAISNICDQQKCQLMVVYESAINSNNLEAFISQTANLPTGTIILLNSQGGDLSSGIRLGQVIRQKGFNTRVGRAQEQQNATVKAPGVCLSSCALAFLGGNQRQIDERDELGFFSLQSTQKFPSKLSEEDLKKALSNIARYLDQMNINGTLLEQIMRIEGNSPLLINPTSAKALNIENASKSELNPWIVQALDNGVLVAITSQKQTQGQFNITLGLSKASGDFRLIVLIKPSINFIEPKKLIEQLSKSPPILIAKDKVLKLKLDKNWQQTATGSQANFFLIEDDLLQIASQVEFEFQLPPNIKQLGLDQNTLFSTRGLVGAVIALKK
jgi:hypothetical protein